MPISSSNIDVYPPSMSINLFIRNGSTTLLASELTPIVYSSPLSGNVNAVSLSCKDGDGFQVEVTISEVTTTGFFALCPVNATLIWQAMKEL